MKVEPTQLFRRRKGREQEWPLGTGMTIADPVYIVAALPGIGAVRTTARFTADAWSDSVPYEEVQEGYEVWLVPVEADDEAD